MTYCTKNLIDDVAAGAEISKIDAKSAVNSMIAIISKQLMDGKEIQLTGFGTFKVYDKAARKGRNPQTGEEMLIPAHKKVTFKAGTRLKTVVG